jgi:hypothetical protein
MSRAKKSKKNRRGSKKLGRIPLPNKSGRPQTTKKGKRGYDRKREKRGFEKEEPRTHSLTHPKDQKPGAVNIA